MADWGTLFTVSKDTADLIQKNPTAVMVMNGAVLAMISIRNQHLSDRARKATADQALTGIPLKRKKSLQNQAIIFIIRYALTSLAFIAMTISLACFGAVSIDSLTNNWELLSHYGVLAFFIWSNSSNFGIYIWSNYTCYELLV